VAADIRSVLEDTAFPPGYSFRFGGSTKDMQESFAYAVSALGLGVIFIYMILASQFRSFLQPLALMSSLPLTLIGVVLALLMFRSTLNMFSIIGIVMLMGLVTKNAILLIDFAIRLREGDHSSGHDIAPMARTEALLLAARVRLRPILMTTLAMIFGMVPLAFAMSEGSEQRAPMGQAVIGGVITSTLLTLVVVPVIYSYIDALDRAFGRAARAARCQRRSRRTRPIAEAARHPTPLSTTSPGSCSSPNASRSCASMPCRAVGAGRRPAQRYVPVVLVASPPVLPTRRNVVMWQ
jgi:HAE1 family hydrophobic/amphiphilic exporter-1